MQTVAERLDAYNCFDPTVVETVAEIAERHRRTSWAAYAAENQVSDPLAFEARNGRQYSVWDYRRDSEDDEPLVHFGAITDANDPNTYMHLLPIAQALPNKRLVAIPSPAAVFEKGNKLSFTESWAVAHNNNLLPTDAPWLEWLEAQGISRFIAVGYSFGADRVLVATQYAGRFNLQVSRFVSAEPAGITQRGVKIVPISASVGKHTSRFVQASDSQAFTEARQAAQMWRYPARMLSVGSLAIGWALGKDGYEERTRSALIQQRDAVGHAIWGTESELALDGVMRSITDRVQGEFGEERFAATAIEGGVHAMCDDIDLYSAIMLHGLSKPKAG